MENFAIDSNVCSIVEFFPYPVISDIILRDSLSPYYYTFNKKGKRHHYENIEWLKLHFSGISSYSLLLYRRTLPCQSFSKFSIIWDMGLQIWNLWRQVFNNKFNAIKTKKCNEQSLFRLGPSLKSDFCEMEMKNTQGHGVSFSVKYFHTRARARTNCVSIVRRSIPIWQASHWIIIIENWHSSGPPLFNRCVRLLLMKFCRFCSFSHLICEVGFSGRNQHKFQHKLYL